MITDIVQAFIAFLEKMNNAEDALDPNIVGDAVEDILRLSNVARLKITYYENEKFEGTDNRVTYYVYDKAGFDDEKLFDRRITAANGLVVYEFDHVMGAEPWSERIRDRLSLLTSMLYVFNSRQMLKQVADRFGYFDDAGYHNLRFFITQLSRLSRIRGLSGLVAAHFNLRNFQAINNQVGRKNGDTIMRGFVDGLEECADCEIPVSRIGGDNFIMAFETDKIDKVIKYLSGTVVSFGDGYGESVQVSASAGLYIIDDDFVLVEPSDLLDKVMPTSMIAKNSGRDSIMFYSDELVERKKHNATIQHLLPEAMEKEEFQVYYQPKIDIITNKLAGAEALCRWLHDGRLVPPMEFIPILEKNTDICKLDFYMIDHVCRDIRKWLDEGKKVVKVSVNLSRKHMLDVDLVKHVMEIIDRHNVPHELIEVELTETTTDVEFTDLKRVVGGLQQRGISASVDDFGTGYSSLNLIKEVPWNVIKIHKSIVPVDSDDERSPRSVMFKYVVAMAKEMGLECIAEGVETEAQVGVLKRNGCDLAQGFFFDRPLPKPEFEKRLDGNN